MSGCLYVLAAVLYFVQFYWLFINIEDEMSIRVNVSSYTAWASFLHLRLKWITE